MPTPGNLTSRINKPYKKECLKRLGCNTVKNIHSIYKDIYLIRVIQMCIDNYSHHKTNYSAYSNHFLNHIITVSLKLRIIL